MEKEEKDFPKAIERGRREVVATREWQELLAWREGWVVPQTFPARLRVIRFSKLPEGKCSLCEKGTEDLKYGPIRRKDRVAALETLALKMLEWKKPDEALKQRKYAEGYDSLVRERHEAMKYHGLDVEGKE